VSLDPVTAVLDVGGKLIDRLWPDPTKAAEAKLAMITLQQKGEFDGLIGQLEINREEAKNPSLFVSGWRPFIGWVCGVALVYSFLGQPLLGWGSTILGIAAPPSLDMGTLLTLLAGMLGLGGLRTAEKLNGVASK
jgi:hypothetical protein